MAHDALDHVLADVIALAHPNQQSLLWVGQKKGAPVIAVVHQVMGAEGRRRCRQHRRFGGAHQQLAVSAPHLKGQAGFIRVGDALLAHAAHRLVKRLIQTVPVGFIGIALAQYALQQARTLGELGVVDLFDFVVAVAQHQPTDQGIAQQDQHQHRDEDACAYRVHGVSTST